MTKRLAYLGPAGTFSEQAALLLDPQAQLIPFATVAAVATAVASGMADEGVMADREQPGRARSRTRWTS